MKKETFSISTARTCHWRRLFPPLALPGKSALSYPELAASCGEGANTPAADSPTVLKNTLTPRHAGLVTFSVSTRDIILGFLLCQHMF